MKKIVLIALLASLWSQVIAQVVNPALVISNWNAGSKCELRLGNQLLKPGTDYEQGLIYNTSGTQSLVVWIKTIATKPLDFSIKASSYVR